jgi:hypothetical protein
MGLQLIFWRIGINIGAADTLVRRAIFACGGCARREAVSAQFALRPPWGSTKPLIHFALPRRRMQMNMTLVRYGLRWAKFSHRF